MAQEGITSLPEVKSRSTCDTIKFDFNIGHNIFFNSAIAWLKNTRPDTLV